MIAVSSSAAINNVGSEPATNILENAVEEVNENQSADLETAEGGFGPRVVVINKGFGGYGGYGGYGHRGHHHHHHHAGCGCGHGFRHFGKKK